MAVETEPLWDIEDVAVYLDIPLSSVYKMTARRATNPIPHVKLGGRLRFRKEKIDEWLDLWAVSPVETQRRAKHQARGR